MKKPTPTVQTLGFYGQLKSGGGCYDVGVLQLAPGVGLYHEADIQIALIQARHNTIPYLLSVLEVLRK